MQLKYLRTASPTSGVTSPVGPIGVDIKSKVVRGFVVAERGEFKTPGRGRFDDASLDAIVSLMRAHGAMGVPSRFTHPTGDAMVWFLGRARNTRRDGRFVRSDLHIDPSAFISPSGDLGTYVLTRSKSDPTSFGSSLVLDAEREFERKGGYANGSPVWRPRAVMAIDVVGDGDAVHSGFLPDRFSTTDDALQLDIWCALQE